MKRTIFFLLVLPLLLFGLWRPAAQEAIRFQIIVHPENPVTSLSRTEVSRILLRKTSRWEDGTAMEPVDQEPRAATREAFTKEIHGRTVANINNFWQRQIFSGRDVPPPELPGDAAVVDFVSRRPGSIGYVAADTALDGVKVIAVEE